MSLVMPLILQLHNRMIIVAISKIIVIEINFYLCYLLEVEEASPTSEITINATAQKL